jgi:uncharacterized damage-inducible protein DinB
LILRAAAAGLILLSRPMAAQMSNAAMQDLLADVAQVERKLVGLANEMPAATYDWRPMEGVRSVGEVFLHVAADNYLLPTFDGIAAPASTGVTSDYATAQAFEQRALSRDEIIAALQVSFGHLKVRLFGRTMTGQALWILAVTHLHEHLGQAIAYARSNEVVPPWSRGGM